MSPGKPINQNNKGNNMKTKATPIAEIDGDTGMYRVTYQWCKGGLILGKLFDGTSEGFDKALAFARSVTGHPSVFCEVPPNSKSAIQFEPGTGIRLQRTKQECHRCQRR